MKSCEYGPDALSAQGKQKRIAKLDSQNGHVKRSLVKKNNLWSKAPRHSAWWHSAYQYNNATFSRPTLSIITSNITRSVIYAECRGFDIVMVSVIMLSRYAGCRYAECRYTKCCGAFEQKINKLFLLKTWINRGTSSKGRTFRYLTLL